MEEEEEEWDEERLIPIQHITCVSPPYVTPPSPQPLSLSTLPPPEMTIERGKRGMTLAGAIEQESPQSCVCARVRACACVCSRACARVYVFVCVCARARKGWVRG